MITKMLSTCFVIISVIVGLSSATYVAQPGVGAGDSPSILAGGQAFAASVKSSFISQAASFQQLANILSASISKSSSPLYGISNSLLSATVNVIQNMCNSLTTVASEFGNDVTAIGGLFGSDVTPNGYLILSENNLQSFLGIVLSLQGVTYTLASDLDVLSGGLSNIQAHLYSDSTSSTLFNALIAALNQASSSFYRGGNDWTAIGTFLQTMGKNQNGNNISSSAMSSNVYFLKTAFTAEVGSDFADMMIAFNGILSAFTSATQQINNLAQIL